MRARNDLVEFVWYMDLLMQDGDQTEVWRGGVFTRSADTLDLSAYFTSAPALLRRPARRLYGMMRDLVDFWAEVRPQIVAARSDDE